MQRASVRSARAWAQDDVGVSVWEVAEEHLDEAVLRQRFDAIVAGRVDPAARLKRRPGPDRPVGRRTARGVGAGDRARGPDRRPARRRPPVCAALARLDLTVRSAHVDTLGPQAVDVFYVQEAHAGVLSDTRAAEAAHAVRDALSG